jgi:pimeloyl-ACP methyl ester carboxylesterase
VEALDLLGVDRFAVLGHHTGAMIVAEMAASFPTRVTKCVASGYPRLTAEGRDYLAHTQPQEFSEDGHELVEIWTSRIGAEPFDVDLRLRSLLAKIQAGRDWHWAYRAVAACDPKELARRVTVPTLVIAGRADGLRIGSERAVEKEFPNAQLVVIEGAGSNTPDEVPDQFVEIIDRFLRA